MRCKGCGAEIDENGNAEFSTEHEHEPTAGEPAQPGASTGAAATEPPPEHGFTLYEQIAGDS